MVSSRSHPPDVKKMPLGKLSKQQIARGFEALEAVEGGLRKPPRSSGHSLEELSSTSTPSFPTTGRSQPRPINSPELLQAEGHVASEGWQVTKQTDGQGDGGQRDGL